MSCAKNRFEFKASVFYTVCLGIWSKKLYIFISSWPINYLLELGDKNIWVYLLNWIQFKQPFFSDVFSPFFLPVLTYLSCAMNSWRGWAKSHFNILSFCSSAALWFFMLLMGRRGEVSTSSPLREEVWGRCFFITNDVFYYFSSIFYFFFPYYFFFITFWSGEVSTSSPLREEVCRNYISDLFNHHY